MNNSSRKDAEKQRSEIKQFNIRNVICLNILYNYIILGDLAALRDFFLNISG